jgi:hypothetical protein
MAQLSASATQNVLRTRRIGSPPAVLPRYRPSTCLVESVARHAAAADFRRRNCLIALAHGMLGTGGAVSPTVPAQTRSGA